jgi:uncharacterized membrane protein YdjX (TVP38/TMEM64 family)
MNDAKKGGCWMKLFVLLAFVGVGVLLAVKFGDSLSLASLAEKESDLREFRVDNPVLVYGLAFLIYIAVTGFSLPGAAILTLVVGWLFGFWHGLVLVSFASTAGATLAFLMSRYVVGQSIQSKFGERLAAFNRALERDGAFYLFTLRLIPAVPFFVINLVMGLTTLPARTFCWVSQIGMLPGTAVFVWAGSAVPDLQTISDQGIKGILTPKIIAAFVALGLFPLVIKFIMNKVRPAAAALPEGATATVEKGDSNG